MKIIKILLVVSFSIIFLWAFRNRYRVELRAGARLVAFLLTALAVISILIPNVTQALADFVGVTRGTDLLLYVLVVVFAATSTGTYFRSAKSTAPWPALFARTPFATRALLMGFPAATNDIQGYSDSADVRRSCDVQPAAA